MIDTGSPVTWLECNYFAREIPYRGPNSMYIPGPSNMVSPEDERCVALHRDLGVMFGPNPDECGYTISYVEESSTGVLVADSLSLPTNNRDSANLAFGCAYDKKGGPDGTLIVDGVLGLSRGTGDFVSQLKRQDIITDNVFGHCIGIGGGGFLFFGGDSGRVPASGVTWLPLSLGSYYSPGAAKLNLNVVQEYPVSENPMKTIFDSGSTYSYVPSDTYTRLVSAVGVSIEGSSLTVVNDPELPKSRCWQGNELISSIEDVKNTFHPLDLTFGHGDSQVQVTLDIPSENYIIVTKNGNVCLGIFNGGDNKEMLIGANLMQNHVMIYDNERARIGWVRASCDDGHGPLIGSRL
uniref:Uncharacterized protein n=1 Tax=Avena sativa TaxID=4498 RepID=A0ACD5WBE3_AVESA